MDKQFYMLAVAEVHFSVDGQIGNPTKVNVVSIGATKDLRATELGNIQHSAAQALTQKVGVALEVHDVIIMNIVQLGEYTLEEFNNLPEGESNLTDLDAEAPASEATDTVQ